MKQICDEHNNHYKFHSRPDGVNEGEKPCGLAYDDIDRMTFCPHPEV